MKFKSTNLNHLGHVALRTGVLRRILHPHQNQEVKVVPHAVLRFDMLLKGHRLVVKFVPFQSCKTLAVFEKNSLNVNCFVQKGFHVAVHTADETRGFENLLLSLFLAPQIGKCVNDHTKDEIKNNDDDDEEEQKVVNHSGCKKGLLDS